MLLRLFARIPPNGNVHNLGALFSGSPRFPGDPIDEYTTIMRVGAGDLLHVPAWFIYPKLEEGDYAIAFDGSTGKI